MDAEEFRRFGKQMVDYVADYLENIRDRKPFPDVSPGYLKELIPDKAPDEAEQWPDVMKDIERVIMPGVRWMEFFLHSTVYITILRVMTNFDFLIVSPNIRVNRVLLYHFIKVTLLSF